MKVGKRLKQLREELNMTQKELADKLGISRAAVGLYEQGKRNVDNDTLLKLSEIFNVSADYLLGNTDIKMPVDKISSALSDDPDLLAFWNTLKEREDLQLLFKQTKDMSPRAIRQVVQIIKIIESEEHERYNS